MALPSNAAAMQAGAASQKNSYLFPFIMVTSLFFFWGFIHNLDPALIRTVAGPNNEGLPNFQFCLYVKGQPWDGVVYSLDKRTALMFE